MKVSTDACVLGAVADVAGARRILDIGTGTGLLALMAAQRNPIAQIEAVELDEAAATQAQTNFTESPWAHQLTLHAQALAEFAATMPSPFDHILCNPPFFRHSLRPPDARRATARHTAPDTLTFAELAHFAMHFLAPEGRLTVLLPPPKCSISSWKPRGRLCFPFLALCFNIGRAANRSATSPPSARKPGLCCSKN
ncbi:methyltransferase [Hymenobacter volaticus]|uniref:Methyltransferase n=2 Tax=Hymenobacter volaticus TaxID=2932254 RepID=A0ABY4GC65_9BACT|nr:methyltransferase [Hymenobacter volaticus]